MYVELKNVNKNYGSFQASKDINFGIEKGKLIALSSDETQLDMLKHRCKLCLCWDGECKSWNKTECPVYIKIKELSK